MKNVILTSLLLISTQAFASKLVNIKKFTNNTVDQVATEIGKNENVTHSAYKKVIELKANANSPEEVRQNTVKQALHTLCGFFDDGVSISLNTHDDKGSLSATSDFLLNTNLNESDAGFKTLLNAISKANKQIGVEVYSGSASGNNTAGDVLGIFDVKNNEIAIFANTNCGSDD